MNFIRIGMVTAVLAALLLPGSPSSAAFVRDRAEPTAAPAAPLSARVVIANASFSAMPPGVRAHRYPPQQHAFHPPPEDYGARLFYPPPEYGPWYPWGYGPYWRRRWW
jgi:hypothetical protein